MTPRTYNPEDYSLETQAAMRVIVGLKFDSSNWCRADLLYVTDIADAIEKAVLEAKKVTEEKVRAACAAVAEVYLKGDPK